MSAVMDLGSLNWKSFWDLATPERAAHIMLELYGADAAGEAAACAAAARTDNREADAEFWDATQLVLCRRHPTPPTATAPPR